MPPVATQRASAVETLDQQACVQLLATQEVGRFGFSNAGAADIATVNFVMDGDAVVFAAETGAVLWGATRSAVVFEVGDADPTTGAGWSVLLHGLAQEVTACDTTQLVERIRALRPSLGNRAYLVRIAPWGLTGWRILAGGSEDPESLY
jgi:nitroimidazol reductase NimA-like FMN-containing flavoprotein (pyridoxamine 5'-phosphate oxidase superfamily)